MKIQSAKSNLIQLLSLTVLTVPSFALAFLMYNPSLNPQVPEAKSSTKVENKYITIKAVGDIVAGTNFPDYRLPKNKHDLLPKQVKDKLQGTDILFGNYESTLTKHPHSTKDTNQDMVFAFRSPPEYAKLFSKVGFDVMSVANNHSMDFGTVGFKDTIKNLDTAGVVAVGAKNQIRYSTVKGIPVAWIGFCFNIYCNSVNDLETAKKLVNIAKQKAKIVIISMHVGAEGGNALRVKNKTEFFFGQNRGNSLEFARTMVDAGADLILGHGPHVPRAMEVYKGKLIAYSLGNFVGYKTLSTSGNKGKSLILEAKINSQGDFISGNIIPIKLNKNGIPQLDKSFQSVKLVQSLTKIDFKNTKLNIHNHGKLTIN